MNTDRILYADRNFAVVTKLVGEVCESLSGAENPYADGKRYISLPDSLKPVIENSMGQKIDFCQCVNRLDTPVSGICVLALSKDAFTQLSHVFRENNTEKMYMAVTEKSPRVLSVGEWHSLENYMIFDTKKQKAKITDEKTVKSKYAALAYRLVGTGERYNFLEIKLKTGRTHQIRCQLAYAGHIIRGDVKYGARRSQKEGGIRLHNFRLAFTDPYRETTKCFCVPPTKDSLWQVAWEAIENVSGTDVENI